MKCLYSLLQNLSNLECSGPFSGAPFWTYHTFAMIIYHIEKVWRATNWYSLFLYSLFTLLLLYTNVCYLSDLPYNFIVTHGFERLYAVVWSYCVWITFVHALSCQMCTIALLHQTWNQYTNCKLYSLISVAFLVWTVHSH